MRFSGDNDSLRGGEKVFFEVCETKRLNGFFKEMLGLVCEFPVISLFGRLTPRKINMEHNHGGLEDHFPF